MTPVFDTKLFTNIKPELTLNAMNERLKEIGAILVDLGQCQAGDHLFSEVSRHIHANGEWSCRIKPRRKKLQAERDTWSRYVVATGHTPQEAFDNAIKKFLEPKKPVRPSSTAQTTKLSLDDLEL